MPVALGQPKYSRVRLSTSGDAILVMVRPLVGNARSKFSVTITADGGSGAGAPPAQLMNMDDTLGVPCTATTGFSPPSTCTISCSAVCISDSMTLSKVAAVVLISLGTQLNQPTVHRFHWSRCMHTAKPAMPMLGDGRAVTMIIRSACTVMGALSPKLVCTAALVESALFIGRSRSADEKYVAACSRIERKWRESGRRRRVGGAAARGKRATAPASIRTACVRVWMAA